VVRIVISPEQAWRQGLFELHKGTGVRAHDDSGSEVFPVVLGRFRAVFARVHRSDDDSRVAIADADPVSNMSDSSVVVLQGWDS